MPAIIFWSGGDRDFLLLLNLLGHIDRVGYNSPESLTNRPIKVVQICILIRKIELNQKQALQLGGTCNACFESSAY